jgi:hypothetical protein
MLVAIHFPFALHPQRRPPEKLAGDRPALDDAKGMLSGEFAIQELEFSPG